MTVSPVGATASDSAFGLDFKSLLQIILQQLQYQDPLKPMDNFQFVSQLAEFSQLQQSQTLNTSVASLLASQSSLQATSLLGKTVGYTINQTPGAGVVQSVTFSNNQPSLTIKSGDQTFAGIALTDITQVQQQ